MLRIRLVLLSLLATCAVGAIASTSASAHAFFVENKEVAGTETVEIEGTNALLKQGQSTIAGTKIAQECEEAVISGVLEKEGKGTGEIKTGKCTLYEIKNGNRVSLPSCTISTPTFKLKEALITSPGGVVETEFKPASGTLFFEIVISGSLCTIKGHYTVEGTQTCASPEAEVQKVSHELICTSTGSKLKFGTQPAAFFSTGTGKVKSGKKSYAE